MYISGRYLGFVGLEGSVIGVIFLWAGLEKAIGAGLGTWVRMGSSSSGRADRSAGPS